MYRHVSSIGHIIHYRPCRVIIKKIHTLIKKGENNALKEKKQWHTKKNVNVAKIYHKLKNIQDGCRRVRGWLRLSGGDNFIRGSKMSYAGPDYMYLLITKQNFAFFFVVVEILRLMIKRTTKMLKKRHWKNHQKLVMAFLWWQARSLLILKTCNKM